MRLAVLVEPQLGASYADQLRIAQHAEALGFEAFFRSDHFLSMGASEGLPDSDGLPGPTDSWITLAAIAVQTERIRLGTLMTSATFRLPGLLAVTVAQIDQMSGGRVELGLGAGWFEAEHAAYGVPFPPVQERFDHLDEQLAVVTGLWETRTGERFSFDGVHYQVADSPALPKPAQFPRPPIIIGGHGERRTPDLAARHADEFNVPFGSLLQTQRAYSRVIEACQRVDRMTPVLSAAQIVTCGRTESEAMRRAERIGQVPLLHGSANRVVDLIGAFADAGTTRMFLEVIELHDLDHLDVLASIVAPQLR